MEQKFQIGSDLHFLILFLTVAFSAISIGIVRTDRFRVWADRIGFGIASVLILNYIAYVIYRIGTGHWEIRYDLPMEFCNWSMIVAAIALYSHNRTFAELSYFWVMSGSVNGVLTPDLSVSFPHPYFFIFFIAHSGLVIASLYVVFGLRLEPRPGSVFRTFCYSQIYFVSAFVLDFLLGANYGYMRAKPSGGSALDLLGE
ncbi:TIGR02206 family membrane protein, partial [Leptospira ellisii]